MASKKIKKIPPTTRQNNHSIPFWGWPFIILIIAALLFALVVMVYGLYWIVF